MMSPNFNNQCLILKHGREYRMEQGHIVMLV
jgi:hypothetical protein